MSMVPTALELKMGHRWGMGSSLFLIGAHFETNFVNVIKMGQPRALLLLFMVFSNKQYQLLQQCQKCHVHPVYGAVIRTHNLLNMSRIP